MSGIYHCAILVFDLEDGIDRLGRAYGVPFREPETRQLLAAPGAASTVDEPVRFAFSVGDRYPYLELVEAQPSGLFGRQHGEGLHHIGCWRDLAGARTAQERAGLDVTHTFVNADGSDRALFATDGRLRIESVDESLRPDYDRWLGVADQAVA